MERCERMGRIMRAAALSMLPMLLGLKLWQTGGENRDAACGEIVPAGIRDS